MKIFTSSAIRNIDARHIEKTGVSSLDLMEQAASAVACEIISRWLPSQRIFIFAGPGNNGGDALAVARLLIDQGYKPEVLLFNTRSRLSADCEANKRRLSDLEYPYFQEVVKSFEMPEIKPADVVVDGLFGSGLAEPLLGGYMVLVRAINESGAFVVSIDVPSGLFGEFNRTNTKRNIVHADLTLAFQFPRLSFFFEENAVCLGEWKVLDIGLDADAIAEETTNYFLIDEAGVREAFRPRNPFTSKDDYGRVYLAAGSFGMMGAAVLAARAVMRAGAGVVTVHAPECGYYIMQSSVPEAIFEPDPDDYHTSRLSPHPKSAAVAIGPGLGTDKRTVDALEQYLKQAGKPLLLDADALNCIALRPAMLNDIPRDSVITPHAGEFDRLFAEHYSGEERFLKAVEMAKLLKIVIVLKGHYTMVFRPDGKVFVNATGNAGMATAGSGDVLTGIIAALMGQKYPPHTAASMGVFIHGTAGNLAKKRHGEMSMVASDLNDCIGEAVKKIIGER